MLARDLEARGRARATITRRLRVIAGFYKYAVEERLDHSPRFMSAARAWIMRLMPAYWIAMNSRSFVRHDPAAYEPGRWRHNRMICVQAADRSMEPAQANIRRSGSMRLREKVAQQLPLRRKHTGRIMEDYAFLRIYASRRNALNSA
jgi:hypothetical protein